MELSTSTPLSQPSDQNAVDTNKVYDMSLYSYLIQNVNVLGCCVEPGKFSQSTLLQITQWYELVPGYRHWWTFEKSQRINCSVDECFPE